MYRSKERLLDAEIGRDRKASDRRGDVVKAIEAWLGCPLRDADALFDRYLIDALYRWLLACTRTADSLGTYLHVFRSWCVASDKRSLSDHASTVPRDLLDYLYALEGRGLAKRSIVLHRDVLRSWFTWLEDRDLIARSPITRDARRAFRVDHKAVGKGDGTRQAFTAAEAQRVTDWALCTAEPREGLSVLLELSAGLRSDEVAHLERSHLVDRRTQSEGITLTVPGKGQRVRIVELEPVVAAAWDACVLTYRLQGARGALIRKPGGGRYSRRTIQSWAKKAAALVGRPEISSHDFRKTAITLRMEQGATLDEAQQLAGHSNPMLTARCYVVRRKRGAAGTGLTVTSPLGKNDAPISQIPSTESP